MLERLLRKAGRPGNFTADLQESSNRLFSSGNAFEELVKGTIKAEENIETYLENKQEQNKKNPYNLKTELKEIGLNVAKHSAQVLAIAALVTEGLTYSLTETVSRIGETAIRGIPRATGKVSSWIKKDDAKTKLRQTYTKIHNFTSSLKKSISKTTNDDYKTRLLMDIAVVGMSVLFSYQTGKTVLNQDYTNLFSLSQTAEKSKPLDSISNFKNIRNVLVVAANQGEKLMADDQFGTLLPDFGRLRSNGVFLYKRGDMNIYLLRQDQQIPDLEYDVIQLRGHTTQMEGLYDVSKNYKSDNAIILLGGSAAGQFVPEMADKNTAVMARDETINNGSQNTLMLSYVLNDLNKFETWKGFRDFTRQNSMQAREYLMPGDSK